MTTAETATTHETVRAYYGETLKTTADLKTNACCDPGAVPAWLRPLLANIHPDVTARFYGCGLVVPEALARATILDLGCGTGRDVFLLAQLAGPEGRVIGVDMTEAQLAVARATEGWHRTRFGRRAAPTEFHLGLIERLADLPIAPGSVDLVVSNCVVNLSPDKAAVLRGVFDLLKPGGEFHFSDVYADRRVPEGLRADPVLLGECLSGALYWRDFERLAAEAGFARPRRIRARPLAIADPAVAAKIGPIRFHAADYRLFKLSDRPGEEDYGDVATYAGGLPGAEAALTLDAATSLPAGVPTPVSAETALILGESRLAAAVDLRPGDGVHRGPFSAAGLADPAPSACGG